MRIKPECMVFVGIDIERIPIDFRNEFCARAFCRSKLLCFGCAYSLAVLKMDVDTVKPHGINQNGTFLCFVILQLNIMEYERISASHGNLQQIDADMALHKRAEGFPLVRCDPEPF